MPEHCVAYTKCSFLCGPRWYAGVGPQPLCYYQGGRLVGEVFNTLKMTKLKEAQRMNGAGAAGLRKPTRPLGLFIEASEVSKL